MTLLLGAVGWGLFTAGAISHLSHLDRLEFLLRAHVSFARVASRLLAGAEALIAVLVPVAFFLDLQLVLTAVAGFGTVVALGFTGWVLRLLLTGSDLPCACSFSSAPTSIWSVVRAAATGLIAFMVFAQPDVLGDDLATIITGAAIAMAIFVLPDALSWPRWAQDMRDYAKRNAAQQTAAVGLGPDVRP